MSGSLPFYQKHRRHYDRDYRSTETQALASKYRASSRSINGYPAHTCTSGGYPAHTCNSGYPAHICTGHALANTRTSNSRG